MDATKVVYMYIIDKLLLFFILFVSGIDKIFSDVHDRNVSDPLEW